jgi:hypothetical protein
LEKGEYPAIWKALSVLKPAGGGDLIGDGGLPLVKTTHKADEFYFDDPSESAYVY